jgi:hypothetical protein
VPGHSPLYPRIHQHRPGLDKMLERALDPCRAEFRHAICELDNRAHGAEAQLGAGQTEKARETRGDALFQKWRPSP